MAYLPLINVEVLQFKYYMLLLYNVMYITLNNVYLLRSHAQCFVHADMKEDSYL